MYNLLAGRVLRELYLETLSKADTIVFDKTGTLTRATPKVVKVVPFSGCSESEVLQLAACLEELVILKTIANALQRRVSANYRFVLTFNSALIALGAMDSLQPASSAMLHNLSTIGISLKSMTNLIPEEKAQKALAEKN